jgi:CRP-like cAMP-binding protein
MGSGLRLLDREPRAMSRLAAGGCVLVSPFATAASGALEVVEGIARVYCPCEETEGMTIAFLQAGESIRTDRLCSEGICVEAITPLVFCRLDPDASSQGFDPVNEWTLQLLRIRHLGRAEQRLQALLSLLVNRMGQRCGNWCVLPFRLTHERIGELIGTTRVTTTKLLSRLRAEQQLLVPAQEPVLCLDPTFIASSPLAA